MTRFLWILLAGVAMSGFALVGSVTLVLSETRLHALPPRFVAFGAGSLVGGALFDSVNA